MRTIVITGMKRAKGTERVEIKRGENRTFTIKPGKMTKSL